MRRAVWSVRRAANEVVMNVRRIRVKRAARRRGGARRDDDVGMIEMRKERCSQSNGSAQIYETLLREFFRSREVDLDAQAVIYNLYRTATDVVAVMESSVLQPCGLTHAGFVLLMTLWIGGPREVRALARVQRVSRPAIVSAVDTLERAGLVRRVRSKQDRRLVRVEITTAGRSLVERVQSQQHRFERTVSGVLSRAERRMLSGLLRRIGGALQGIEGGSERPALRVARSTPRQFRNGHRAAVAQKAIA